MRRLPVVDLGASQSKICTALHQSLTTLGFCYVRAPQLPTQQIAHTLSFSKWLFDLPVKERRKMLIPELTHCPTRGYYPFEGTAGQPKHDIDAFAFGPANQDGVALRQQYFQKHKYDWRKDLSLVNNVWPTNIPEVPAAQAKEFQEHFEQLFQTLTTLLHIVLHHIGIIMELSDPDALVKMHSKADHVCELKHYKPLPPWAMSMGEQGEDADERMRGHCDLSTITFLLQDKIGGLQIQQPTLDGKSWQWEDIQPNEDVLVMNTGRFLTHWSSQLFPSTQHRVVTADKTQSRYSVVMFCIPDWEVQVEPLLPFHDMLYKEPRTGTNDDVLLEPNWAKPFVVGDRMPVV
eukprot:TRINITY_DN60056_c0_g1_i1.p1 TRINITY_DN60056_c0_g1~~TRINITY_DN60056_c0_g1_i1.p1  ORF type:complete len:347 (+),score=27.86 TRINITY_DN60056_c0_g1_i1:70-1110(+)